MPLQPGETFGRYQVAELLGRGGMGEVYSAHDSVLHRMVALKVLAAPATAGDDAPPSTDGAARILREARAAAGIAHPNAVAIYDVGEVDGVPFLAMELVAGRTLRTFRGDASVPLERRIRWLVDVAHALGAAHALGLVHRDVKPDNVMVRDDGLVKVLDFGIARRRRGGAEAAASRAVSLPEPVDLALLETIARESGTLTAGGILVGTPMYMAPEQLRGEALDGRTDQFAWGALAYEVLTGKLPWRQEGLMMLSEILSRDVAPLAEIAPEVPPRVDAIVRKALGKAPGDRFRTMEELADALEPFAASTSRQRGRPDRVVALAGKLQLITWSDVFVLVDHGQAGPAEYATLGEVVVAEAAKYPAGIGALTIIPPNAKPPAESARVALSELLQRLGSSIRCICWLVEGAGFQGAMARGVLTGVRMFGRLPYDSHVSSEITEALGWLLGRLDGTKERLPLVPDGVRWIEEQRRLVGAAK